MNRVKNCAVCGCKFSPKRRLSQEQWRRRKVCSMPCAAQLKVMNVSVRFHQRYQRDKETGCWLWTAGKDSYGYGCMSVNGKMKKAPRLSWELHGRILPPGKHVLHHCDTPACVNPDHLFTGVAADNVKDMVNKKRGHWQKWTARNSTPP